MTLKKSDAGPLPTPERAVYGFGLYVLTLAGFILYSIWTYIPPELLDIVGLSYWPSRHWSISGPLISFALLWSVVYIVYPLICQKSCVANANDSSIFTDDFAVISSYLTEDELSLNPVSDYSISKINTMLYSK